MEGIPRLRALRKRLEANASPDLGPLVFGDGNSMANIAVVAYEPDDGERQAHTGGQTSACRGVLLSLGVPPHACWYTYVLKQRQQRILTRPLVQPWVEDLWEELEIIKPAATILLGVETAWAVLGTQTGEVDELRKRRFIHGRGPFTNFFVTYSSDEVVRAGLGSTMASIWSQDLMAVVTVTKSYFVETKIK